MCTQTNIIDTQNSRWAHDGLQLGLAGLFCRTIPKSHRNERLNVTPEDVLLF